MLEQGATPTFCQHWWENQTPSRNPALETIFLLAEFELAMACSAFVHGQSFFQFYLSTCKWTD